MLPEYQAPQLTMGSLTDGILETALERLGYTLVSLETARAVCYQWMSSSMVSLTDLTAFLQQLPPWETVDADYPLLAVEHLCKEVSTILNGESTLRYLPLLEQGKVKNAMKRAGVHHVDVEQMSLMLANLAVAGANAISEDFDCMLYANNITVACVIEVANFY